MIRLAAPTEAVVTVGDLAAAGMFLMVVFQAWREGRKANLDEKRRIAAEAAAKAKGVAEESAIVAALKAELEATRAALKEGLKLLGDELRKQADAYGNHELECGAWRAKFEQLVEALVKTQDRFADALDEQGKQLAALKGRRIPKAAA